MGRRVVLQNRKEVTKDEFTILELEFQWPGQCSGGFRGAPPPHGPKFLYFHRVFQKIWLNYWVGAPPRDSRPLLGEVLDPPLQWTQLLKYYRVLEAQGHTPNQFYFCTTFRNVLPDLNCPNGARRLSFSVISWHQIMFPASKQYEIQVKCNYLPWIKLLVFNFWRT